MAKDSIHGQGQINTFGCSWIVIACSLIGYSGQESIPDVPKPDAGLCGVTKEAFDTVPGASALLDIEVEVSWDDNTVWIGIISVDDYNSLEKLEEILRRNCIVRFKD